MKYLCLVVYDEKKLEVMSKSELEALDAESLAFDDSLRKSGHLIAADPLQPIRSTTTVRVQRDKVSVTDGPFLETNEQVGGFVLINAKDLNEAIEIGSRIPPGRLGAIEVRPIKERKQN
jgi:hypothetical protein